MARRPGGEDPFVLSPRARRIAGWMAAALLIGVVALAVRLLGGNGDGTVLDPSPSGPSPSEPVITFGTALDPDTDEVAAEARTNRFAEGDTFAYSVSPSGTELPQAVYVEVRRAGLAEPEQAPVDPQALPADRDAIGFSVPAADLLAVFGPGEYLMLIYADPAGEPIAEGSFQLVGPAGSPTPSA